MMRRISFFGTVLTMAACISTTTTAGVTKGTAMIDRVEVTVTENSNYRFTAYGSLPDSCTSIDQVTVDHKDNDWTVTITTSRPAGRMCATMIVPFEKELTQVKPDLASAGTLTVNGVKKKFDALDFRP